MGKYANYDLVPVPSPLRRISVVNEPSKEYHLVKPGLYKPIFEFYTGQGFYSDDPLPEACLPLAVNRIGKPLALQYWYGKGRVVFLPEVVSKKEVVSVILSQILADLMGVAEPEWAQYYPFLDNITD